MSRTIAVTNQKGGVGKSTTAHALGAGLSIKGYSVLFVDLDPQGNLSYAMQADTGGLSSYDLLTKRATVADAIQHTEQGRIIPAGAALSAADMELTATGKEYRLLEALEPCKSDFDFIIIDTPPALGTLTINALTAADSLIIPAQAEIFSLQGIGQLSATIKAVKTYCNRGLQLDGILLTRHNGRSVLSRDMAEMIKDTAEKLGTTAYKTVIREGIAIKEAQANRRSIFEYAPKSNAALDYMAFVNEYQERSGRK